MSALKLKNIPCALCGEKQNYTVLYESNFTARDFTVKTFSARRLPDKIHYQIVRCNRCGLVRSTPTASVERINTLYEESELTYNTEIDNLIQTYLASMEPILSKLPQKARILEIGCGNGFILKALFDRGFKHVYGVEPSKDARNQADPKIKKNITLNVFSADLFPKQKFDFIFILQTFDHIPDPNTFLQDCHRVLKPGGKIFAFNHNVQSLSAQVLGEKSPIFDIEHTFLYDPGTIRAIFQKNGFLVNAVRHPQNTLSLQHLSRLLPLPLEMKKRLLESRQPVLETRLNLPLGNLSIEAEKI